MYFFLARLRIFAIFLVTLFCAINVQAAQMHALVVGVSSYPTLPADQQLQAPYNDVIRMREVLQHRGFKAQNIIMLADGVAGAALPTHAAMLTALDKMAKQSQAGDIVVLYFAGHGSFQPEYATTAQGKLGAKTMQPIFLPRDIGKWSPAKKTINNALVKSELRTAVDRISAKGAFVWALFDACHSATLVRGMDNSVRYRSVDPVALGVPEAAVIRANSSTNNPANLGSANTEKQAHGDTVFFYAAQASESTPELTLPIGQRDGKPFGLFSYVLLQALDAGIPMTYHQLAQYILTLYGAMNETAVTPYFSGTGLDQAVLQQSGITQPAALLQQWKLESGQPLTINVGALAQLTVGSILALVANPLAPTSQALGYVKLVRVELNSSTLEPIPYQGLPALSKTQLARASFARLIHAAPNYQLSVSVDASACSQASGPAKSCPLLTLLNDLRSSQASSIGSQIIWKAAPAHGNVMLNIFSDRMLLLPPSLQGMDCNVAKDCAAAIEFKLDKSAMANKEDTTLSTKLLDALHSIARANNLLKIASTQALGAETIAPLAVTIQIIPQKKTEKNDRTEPITTLHNGDRLHISLSNTSDQAVDATILYLDAKFGVSVFYPEQAGAGNRLEPKSTEQFDVQIGAESIGIERLLAISVLAQPNRERADFSFLAQPTLSAKYSQRDLEDADLMAFADAGFADYLTRGPTALPSVPSSRTMLQVFTFNVMQ